MMIVREFRRMDLFRVHEIEKETFTNPYEKNIIQWLYDIGAGFLVAEEKNLILGYTIFSLKKENHGHIISIAVDKEFRNQNIGSTLLKTAINVLKKNDAKIICLEVESSKQIAVNFYNKFGFKKNEVLENYYGDGSDGISMYLKL
ncbi:MAG: ribosomal protein S18-alanine N-acetyltransferase [Methanobrevibacter sp.]|nr:ribosomal protein S18-alanine N-acetyltransferase [Candidatus Methanovirga meridionalis]